MTASTRSTIKAFFETGDKPTQAQFADFIDSCAFLAETSAQKFLSDIDVSGNVIVSGAITGHGGGRLDGFTINTPTVSAGTFFSPDLTGIPTAPTASVGTNTTQLATTAFVASAVSNLGTSGMTWLATVTAAASAIVYSGFDSTYDTYFITGSKVRPSTNGVGLRLRYSIDSGSSYISTAYTAQNNQFKGAAFNGEAPTDGIYIVPTTAGYRASNLEGGSFNIHLHSPGVTGACYSVGDGSYLESASLVNIRSIFSGVWRGGTNAINAIEIAPTSGGLAEGIIRIYGLRKA